MSGYALHPEAFADLDEIRDFIAADSADAADRVITEVFDNLRQLELFPDKGYRRPDLTSRPLRFVLVREYLIAYAPEESPLWLSQSCTGGAAPALRPRY